MHIFIYVYLLCRGVHCLIFACDTFGGVFLCVCTYTNTHNSHLGVLFIFYSFIFIFFICLCLVTDVRTGFPQLTRRQNCGFLPDPNPVCLAAWDTSSNCNVYLFY